MFYFFVFSLSDNNCSYTTIHFLFTRFLGNFHNLALTLNGRKSKTESINKQIVELFYLFLYFVCVHWEDRLNKATETGCSIGAHSHIYSLSNLLSLIAHKCDLCCATWSMTKQQQHGMRSNSWKYSESFSFFLFAPHSKSLPCTWCLSGQISLFGDC